MSTTTPPDNVPSTAGLSDSSAAKESAAMSSTAPPTPSNGRNRAFAVIAGGGTVGHVTPGVAIGRALVERGYDQQSIHFVGSSRGVEATRVPDAGFPITLLPGRGIQRRLAKENIGAVIGLAKAQVEAMSLLRRLKPSVVVSMGGYASVPAALAAIALGVPVVVAEQNAVPGAANRLVGRFAKACVVTFEGTDLPNAVLTGNPVRPEILAVDRATDRAAARERLGIDEHRKMILSFGGSLGARHINHTVVELARRWSDRDDVAIRHIIGDRDWPDLEADFPVSDHLLYQPVRYEEDMPTCLAAADLVLCRSGASSVTELAAVGVGSILVPLPHAPGDHQTANARSLERAGGALLLPDGELDADRLQELVEPLVVDGAKLEAMATAASTVGRRDAAERVADVVLEHAATDRGNQ